MIAHYGFTDGSGEWYVTIDTDKCTGCGNCIEACPAHALELAEDEYDSFGNQQVARAVEEERNKIKYTCAPCKPGFEAEPTPCVVICEPGAISHSDGWKRSYGQE
jgi:NAD-dependent dihydropyrimidine dehydrogenase PreA subunit